MTATELSARVMLESGLATAALGAIAFAVGGAAAGAGVVAAGALTLGNFWWLVRGTAAAAHGRRARLALWGLSAGARFLALLAALAVLLASGRVHPVAVVAGLTILPCALVARGLRAARLEMER
jgi:hypothetical protein